jgi:hypothetical protein
MTFTDDDIDKVENEAQLAAGIKSLATIVTCYYNALIAQGMQPSLAEKLTQEFNKQMAHAAAMSAFTKGAPDAE